ncbi:hypothetical protein C2E23DRAFT_545230 [Lenzites betulinus]|nr:hypothetical protein C2E23DRAFT_545230 [Lenzites betulinus]
MSYARQSLIAYHSALPPASGTFSSARFASRDYAKHATPSLCGGRGLHLYITKSGNVIQSVCIV